MLRITAGIYKGRTLKSPATAATHPMGSREKLALFNTLVSLFSSSNASGGSLSAVENVLDCFCGSGALGLEALSRGAKKVVFVDKNIDAVKTTKDNIAALNISDCSEVIKSDVLKISSSPSFRQKFDLILADPPYNAFPNVLSPLADLLTENGVLVLSHPNSTNPADIFPDLELLSAKSYASANLSFFRRKA